MDGEPENTIPTYCQAKLCNISELCKFSIGLERTAKEVYKTTKFAVTSLKRDGETEKNRYNLSCESLPSKGREQAKAAAEWKFASERKDFIKLLPQCSFLYAVTYKWMRISIRKKVHIIVNL